MLDIRLLREDRASVERAMELRGMSGVLAPVVEADERYRELLRDVEALRAQHNQASKQLGRTKERPPELLDELRVLGERIAEDQKATKDVKDRLDALLLELPNLPDRSVHEGKDASDNLVVRTWGTPRKFEFQPAPHWEMGEKLDIIDFARGVKLSGTRFYVLKGLGARLQRALISFMLDLHTKEHGYREIYPPFMLHRECMVGSGNLPKFADNLYHDAEEDYWFVPTAEVPLTNLHRDEILDGANLPLRYVAYTPCFRREKMAAGKDTRGIKRGHQFDKVELYKYVRPENSMAELDSLVADAEEVLRRLELPYRVVELCTGDLGFASCKTFDLEVWAPGSNEWLEVSSCSNCGDFQARRANLRFRSEPESKPQFVHTLNGSGLALPRVFIAVLENHQQADGTVLVPEVLNRYM
ncbi:MAG: serine--tRNA ligase [Dehalococcoidia bacterium]|jgi:seryl-tRNA synthetase|nr:serine--tRNA ligase [Dehalococcoidia bacterium]